MEKLTKHGVLEASLLPYPFPWHEPIVPVYLASDVDALALDEGCSMAARTDLGHGKNGHCAIRNQPCPPLCLKKQIANLETEIRTTKLLALRWTTDKPTVEGWYWWRFHNDEQFIVEVVLNYHGLYAIMPNAHRKYNALVCDLGGEWAGPIAEPLPMEGGGK